MNQDRLEELANEITKLTGEPRNEVIIKSLEEKLAREREKHSVSQLPLKDKLLAIAREYRALPTLSNKSEAEISEYLTIYFKQLLKYLPLMVKKPQEIG